ncbi:MAG: energy transducer TonB [Sporocytophaga sp.]|uniref:energy transducer TonB n=1 Tax=Sporocytophaga sp. TaxID=2231183 RepID=UPI001B276F27|nr:energy transducer TonB [Sporocytophaga sp.]MBO9703853.1 energy transducer TonB [Sporocytophaga sp.]
MISKYIFIILLLLTFNVIASAQSDFVHESSIVNSKGERIYPDKKKNKSEDTDNFRPPVCPYNLEKFFRENIKYPEEGLKNKLEGKVFVEFTIDSTGKIINPRIVRGLGNGFDEEVMRVFQLMPDWKPGYSDGKPVDSKKVLPVEFLLSKKGKK